MTDWGGDVELTFEDPSLLQAYVNFSGLDGKKDAYYLYDLEISGIAQADTADVVLDILKKAQAINCAENTKPSMIDYKHQMLALGYIRLSQLTAVQTYWIVRQIKPYSLQLRWEQHAQSGCDSEK